MYRLDPLRQILGLVDFQPLVFCTHLLHAIQRDNLCPSRGRLLRVRCPLFMGDNIAIAPHLETGFSLNDSRYRDHALHSGLQYVFFLHRIFNRVFLSHPNLDDDSCRLGINYCRHAFLF